MFSVPRGTFTLVLTFLPLVPLFDLEHLPPYSTLLSFVPLVPRGTFTLILTVLSVFSLFHVEHLRLF
jgi:hypothetical protein